MAQLEKIMSIYYGSNKLPYKDEDRQIHYPIAGETNTFVGENNTTKVRFFVDRIGGSNYTWVAKVKKPNGAICFRVLEMDNDDYVDVDLSFLYTDQVGQIDLALNGYTAQDITITEDDGVYEISGNPTVICTGIIKIIVNYAPLILNMGATVQPNEYQQILALLSTKISYGIESEKVNELPTTGKANTIYYVKSNESDIVYDIYYWNGTTFAYLGTTAYDLYTKEDGIAFENALRSYVNTQLGNLENEIQQIVSGSPKGVYPTLSDLETVYPTGAEGIYVVSADGHWYYWNTNTSSWTDGGAYLSTGSAITSYDASAYKKYVLTQGGFDENGLDESSAYRVRTQKYFKKDELTGFKITGSNLRYSISFYASPNTNRISIINWTNISSDQEIEIPYPTNAHYCRVLVAKQNDETITPNDVDFYTKIFVPYVAEDNLKDIKDIKGNLETLNCLLENPTVFHILRSDLENKAFNENGQIIDTENLTRLVCSKYFPVEDVVYILSQNVNVNTIYISASFYADNLGSNRIGSSSWSKLTNKLTIIPTSGAKYARFTFYCDWYRDISPRQIYATDINNIFFITTTNLQNEAENFVQSIKEVGLEQNIISKLYKCYIGENEVPTYAANGNRITTAKLVEVFGKYMNLKFDFANTIPTYEFSVSFYNAEIGTRTDYTGWIRVAEGNNFVQLPNGTKFVLITIRYSNNSTSISVADLSNLYVESGLMALEKVNEENFGKTVFVKEITGLSRAKYMHSQIASNVLRSQSFCIYDNKFYSLDAYGNLRINNLSDFSVVNNYSGLGTEHANSMQLGNSNIAYVSGWDDNKIYALNLSTIEIDDTYSLPTTGYTTGVIDEVRQLAYVFQRTSNPSTEDYYNFITINLADMSVISSRKTSIKFAAMQAADFNDDKIYVLAGLGTVEAPNKFMIFDLQGNLLEQIYITDTSTIEHEGVFVMRDGSCIYLSDLNGNIHKIY